MQLMTMIYTNAMAESVAFYTKLGLTRDGDGEIDQWWNQYALGDAVLALHWNQDQPLATAGGNPELHVNVDADQVQPLFDTFRADRCAMSDEITTLEGINKRTFYVTDPNGVKIFING